MGIYSYMEVDIDVPFFRPRNISIGILFHPKIYETLSKVFRLPWCMNDHIVTCRKITFFTVSK